MFNWITRWGGRSMLGMDLDNLEAIEMFRAMDTDGGGAIDFPEFGEAMLQQFTDEQIRLACAVELGSVGTTKWDRGQTAWSTNTCLLLCRSVIAPRSTVLLGLRSSTRHAAAADLVMATPSASRSSCTSSYFSTSSWSRC